MNKMFRYRLYPTKQQAIILHKQIDEACRLYNAALEERKTAYRKCGISVSCYDQTRAWTQVRHDGNSTLVHYKIGQDVLQRVDRAFDAFFRRMKLGEKPGYPRFRSRRRYDSITYINYGKTPQTDKKGKLVLKGIGHVRVKWHRPIVGTTKTCTIKREAGRWYVTFSVEYEAKPLMNTREVVGIDVGLDSFATLSDGTTIENPRFGKEALAHLRRAQRRLERRTIRDRRGRVHGKQSRRREKAKLMLQKAYARVARQRRHFHHTEARKLVDRYSLIAVEDLQIKNMGRSAKGTSEKPGSRVKQKSGLNRSIFDAGWGMFVLILFSKAAEAGGLGIKVSAPGTSQVCVCGASVPKLLSDRWHLCLTCGLSKPRDEVSAMVIKKRALLQLSA
jgi:putative transposase